MAVFSRFGAQIEPRRWLSATRIEAERLLDHRLLVYDLWDLRADGGMPEIIAKIGEPPVDNS